MRIFLVGYMGAGKTSFGKKLAQNLGLKFIDLDQQVELQQNASIVEIFDAKGENAFRVIEQEVLDVLLKQDNYVMATGGGTPCFESTMEKLKHYGTTIYLKMEPRDLANRLSHARKERPLIKDKTEEELIVFISESLAQREDVYNLAHITISSGYETKLNEIASELIHGYF